MLLLKTIWILKSINQKQVYVDSTFAGYAYSNQSNANSVTELTTCNTKELLTIRTTKQTGATHLVLLTKSPSSEES